jgi:hypothetical protein
MSDVRITDYGRPEPPEDEKRWTTEEATRDFTFHGFAAPYVVVTRKSDGVKGTLEFTHQPRFYFNFSPSNGS